MTTAGLSRRLSTVGKESTRRVVITGIGILSPLGVGTKNSWEALISGKSGLRKLEGSEYEKLPCRIGEETHSYRGKE